MEDYRCLTMKYIKNNKKKAILSILGVAISVGILFVFLNSVESYLIDYTEKNLLVYSKRELNEIIFTIRLSAWLVAFLFTILGVGVVRNAIQLLLLEQIKDFGLLRCIGATKTQLRKCIYSMGFALEGLGLFMGVSLGYIGYLILAKQMDWSMALHWIALVPILITYIGDMFFAMEDCCKVLKHMTPVDIVKGKYRFHEEKIKSYGKSIWGILFGIEGDYAAKSLKRNPKRYLISVFSVGLGIASLCLTISFEKMMTELTVDGNGNWGVYQWGMVIPTEGDDMLGGQDLSYNKLIKEIVEQSNIKSFKPVHAAVLFSTDSEVLLNHIDKKFYEVCSYAQGILAYKDSLKKEDGPNKQFALKILTSIDFFGYDEEDYARLNKYLLSGTTKLSENGVVLVGKAFLQLENRDTLNTKKTSLQMTDYQVGDRIEVVDFDSLRRKIEERRKYYTKDELQDMLINLEIRDECYKQCIEEGCVKTYVVEGIVDRDPNISLVVDINAPYVDNIIRFIVPKEKLFADTGLVEEDDCGTVFSIKGKNSGDLVRIVNDNLPNPSMGLRDSYLNLLDTLKPFHYVFLVLVVVIIFIMIMNLLNVMNITFSNMYLRRQEFAQLRVLGMSKKRLFYTVLLEAVITAAGAMIIGGIVGYIVVSLAGKLINLLYYMEYVFPWGAYFLISFCAFLLLILCSFIGMMSVKTSILVNLNGNE